MGRLSRNGMLMEHALVASKRGTCSRLHVGAVFSRDGRIITTGYNGAPKGQPHCNHTCDCIPDQLRGDDPSFVQPFHEQTCASIRPCLVAQHAERNGIDFAARHGLSLEGSEVHITHAPCEQCAGSLMNVGVVWVTYLHPYRLTAGVELLRSAGIPVFDFSTQES